MSKENESGWREYWLFIWWMVFWWTLVMLCVCGIIALSGEMKEPLVVVVVLAVAVISRLMVAAPSLCENWKRNAPVRRHAREVRRERAAVLAQQQAEQAETRRQRQAEKVAEARARQEVATARREVETFYRANASLLADVLPPALFKAEIEAAFSATVEPTQAWLTARDLIAKMQPLVRREQERQRQEKETLAKRLQQVREIDEAIRKHRAQIEKLKASSRGDEFIEDEVFGQQQEIKRLNEQRELLQNLS